MYRARRCQQSTWSVVPSICIAYGNVVIETEYFEWRSEWQRCKFNEQTKRPDPTLVVLLVVFRGSVCFDSCLDQTSHRSDKSSIKAANRTHNHSVLFAEIYISRAPIGIAHKMLMVWGVCVNYLWSPQMRLWCFTVSMWDHRGHRDRRDRGDDRPVAQESCLK
jgi:hypothetical protein